MTTSAAPPSHARRALGIRGKLFLVSLGVIATVLVAAELYLSSVLETQLTERIRDDLLVRARLVAQRVESTATALSDVQAADALADATSKAAGVRITLIRDDGTVVGDSELDAKELGSVENHALRPEVAGAKAEGHGADMRSSATIGTRLMYAAVPITRNGRIVGVARVAMPLTDVDDTLQAMHKALGAAALLALAVAVGMSLFAAQVTSRKLRELTDAARRMAGGDLSVRTRAYGDDEVDALARALDHLAGTLAASIGDLQSERDLLTSVLSSMNEGVLVVDADKRIVLANRALSTLLLLPKNAAGKSVLQLIRNVELNKAVESAAGGASTDGELTVSAPAPRRLLVRAVPLSGTPGAVLAVFVDVTELRRLEAVRRDFVANASHELRTPLTVVRAAAETLRDVAGDPLKRAQYIDLIERNADTLEQLIADMLELARIESGDMKLHLGPVPLAATVDAVTAQHAHRAQVKHITVLNEAADIPVRADRRVLEHVLDNLVDNALKYCPDGSVLRIGSAVADGMVRVSVADNGPGIPAEHIDRIFERFYRVDAGRSRSLGGTGLGLSIVKHFVEAMDGTVAVESRVGAGSTFTFTLRTA
ncbi:MAG TPA: ATP-binding protein [Burkholderiales bacterium]|nr:ATP-binding protein [Burkholderiales bacterium]